MLFFCRILPLFTIIFLILLLSSFNISFSQDPPSDELPVEVRAKSITHIKEEDKYLAEGEAVLIHGGVKVEAEIIILYKRENRATAMGEVIITDEEGNLAKGELLEIDLLSKTGVMNNGKLFFKAGNLHVVGERITKTGDETYEVKKGRFTTCNCLTPAWSFKGSEVRATRGEYLVSKNTFFYIKNIPVLYSPYVVLPIKRGRQTGFLRPELGFSDLRGIEIDNSFFWAISKNTDATFFFDYLAERGIGKGLEYRYIRKRGSEGEFFFYHFKEEDIDRIRKFRTEQDNLGHPQDADNDRWLLRFDHSEALPYGITFKADINEVSDDEYFLDFGKGLEERSLQKLESNVVVSKQWARYNLVTQFRFFDDLMVENDEATLQRLPELTFAASSQPFFGTPVHLSLESFYNYFYRREGLRGHRIDIHPEFSLPLNPKGYFELTPKIGFRETLYWTNDGDKDDNRELYNLSLSLQTTFIRIFNWKGEERHKIRHSIRPSVTYFFVPERDQSNLPSFDGADRVSRENKVAYSLTSFLTVKRFEKDSSVFSYSDHIFFELSQSFDINEARWNITSPGDEKRPFSDLKAELKLTPNDMLSFNGKGEYSVYNNNFSNYDLSAGITDRRGDKLDISYSYDRGETEFLDLSINMNIVKGLALFHKSRFSFLGSDSRTLETEYSVELTRQCWGIKVSRIERPDERIFLATINLLGLGEIATIKGKVPESKEAEK